MLEIQETNMRFNFNIFSIMMKEAKSVKETPELTNFLSQSKSFQNAALKIHNLKLKFLQKMDEAAFPENYTQEKMIEHHSKKKK